MLIGGKRHISNFRLRLCLLGAGNELSRHGKSSRSTSFPKQGTEARQCELSTNHAFLAMLKKKPNTVAKILENILKVD